VKAAGSPAPREQVVVPARTVSSNGSGDAESSHGHPRDGAAPVEAASPDRPAEATSTQPSSPEIAASPSPSDAPPPADVGAPAPSEKPVDGPATAAAPNGSVEDEPRSAAATPDESLGEPEPMVDREHVRVHLFDGRVVEGYKRGNYSKENRVLVLDVDAVYDANGSEVPSTPLDSFLLPPQIDRIEALDQPSNPPAAEARAVRRTGKLPAS